MTTPLTSTPLTIACVRTGTKYKPDYVARLRDGVARHLDRPHRFVVLTDRPAAETPAGVERIDITQHPNAMKLPGWWGKMALFSTDLRRLDCRSGRWVYLDLDTVVTGDLSALVDWDGDFGLCANFTRLAGHSAWPCRYGSCVMSFAAGWGDYVWQAFRTNAAAIIAGCPRGDQQAIERLVPAEDITLLQDVLPDGFFLGKRALAATPKRPEACALVIFGGSVKPHNCTVRWVRECWQ